MNSSQLWLIPAVVVVVLVARWMMRPTMVDVMRPTGNTVTRTYKGNPATSAAEFERDARSMAEQGYYPISQQYTPGSWGCGAFLVALLLAVVLIGILIFIYLIVVKPDGTLVVTYEHRVSTPIPNTQPTVADPLSAIDALAKMRDAGHITTADYEAKKAELLERL